MTLLLGVAETYDRRVASTLKVGNASFGRRLRGKMLRAGNKTDMCRQPSHDRGRAWVFRDRRLAAISAGSVLVGAKTYLGNGTNFMVKSRDESAGCRMPSFARLAIIAISVLLPGSDVLVGQSCLWR